MFLIIAYGRSTLIRYRFPILCTKGAPPSRCLIVIVYRRFVLLSLIVLSLILTTGCHLLSHYSEEEVQQYINKYYPNLTYKLEAQRNNRWQVTFDKYPQIPIEISEVLHTSAPVVPQVDRILTTNIPLITAFPLMKNYLTAEELSYATYDTSSLYIEIPIPYSAIQNQDITNFYNRMDQFCKEYAKTYPDFKKEIFIRIIIKPADSSDSPEEYRRIFRLSHY